MLKGVGLWKIFSEYSLTLAIYYSTTKVTSQASSGHSIAFALSRDSLVQERFLAAKEKLEMIAATRLCRHSRPTQGRRRGSSTA